MTSLNKLLKMLVDLTKETAITQPELPKNNSQSLESRFQIMSKVPYPIEQKSPNEEFIDAISNSNFKSIGEMPGLLLNSTFDAQVQAKKKENAALDSLLKQIMANLPPSSRPSTSYELFEQRQEPEIKEDRTDILVKTKRRIQIDGEEDGLS